MLGINAFISNLLFSSWSQFAPLKVGSAKAVSSRPAASTTRNSRTLCDLPEDVLIMVLCQDLNISDLVTVSKTCRRLYGLTLTGLPWISLWHRLAEQGRLPQLYPGNCSLPGGFDNDSTVGETTVESPLSVPNSVERPYPCSVRSRMRWIFGVQHRICSSKSAIAARQGSMIIEGCPLNEYVAMSMTSAGEVLVVWMWSRLLVFDLRSQRSLTLNFTRDSSEVPQSPILATTLCSYHGREGVLVVGTFTQNSKLSVLFQELPQSASAPSDEMPNYLVVSSFAIPAEHRLTCLEFSQQYLIAAYSVLKPDGSIMYYAQAFDLQSERSICVTHNAPIQRACISGKKLIVCFDTGSVGEHELEAVNPTQLVSRSYRSQLSDDLSKRYMFCCPLPKPSDQDNGVFPDVKCWIAPCYYLWTKSMTLSLYPIAFDHANISDPNEEIQSPPETNNTVSSQAMPEFQIPSSQPHEERQTTSWLPSNICRLTSYLLNSIQPKKLDCFRPMQSIAGQSNMLTHLRVKNPDRDLLVLSHASPAGRRGSDPGSCQSWATSYKPVQLLTREGQVKALGRSAKDSLLEFTWNEYTGRIVTATKNSTTSTITIATYEI